MTDRPILFSAPMVRALLAGTKTQTRRVLKKVPMFSADYDRQWHPHVLRPGVAMPTKWSWWEGPSHGPSMYHFQKLPIAVGDRLWVREALECANGEAVGFPADGSWLPNDSWLWERKKLPSIHMPRRLSRITLTVTDVRVERLQDISEADALAEGMTQATADAILSPEELQVYATTHIVAPQARGRILYETIWDQINGPGSWDANPWVAAYSFTVEHGNIDALEATGAA